MSPLCRGKGDGILETSVYSLAVSAFMVRFFRWTRKTDFKVTKASSNGPGIREVYLKVYAWNVENRRRLLLLSFRLNVATGKFITFEGLDGTGKSTQMRKLAAVLRVAGHKVIETREPGGTATGEKIRKVLLDSSTAGLNPMAEMALMFASRAQHIAEVIEPGLAAGAIVLCDRFTDSTEAYQGSGRKLGSEPVRELHRVICGNLQPDLTVLIHPESSCQRQSRSPKKRARFQEFDPWPRREPLRAREALFLHPRT